MKLVKSLFITAFISLSTAVSTAQTPPMSSVVNPRVPKSVTFAGKTYDMNRIDMYERLDRELSAISYTHGTTMLQIKRANRYFPEILPLLKKYGVPDDLIYLACTESSLNPRAYSSAKAAGIWQFIPSKAKEVGLEVNDYVDERYNIEKATAAAAKELKSLYAKYGNWETAFAAYNGGPTRISRELASQQADSAMDLYLTDETSRYMFRILAHKLIMENPKAYGFCLTADQLYTPVEYDIVEVSTPVDDWAAWAKKRGLTFGQLKEHNLWIRGKSLPNKTGKTYRVRIPKKESLYRSTADKTVYNPKWITK